MRFLQGLVLLSLLGDLLECLKLLNEGNVDWWKARLVVLGNIHEYGVKYEETLAPVQKRTTIKKKDRVSKSFDESEYRAMSTS
uniref:Uncharacterized protein n=1 Tax=Solanum lycopersicum TaxID=4081 RepID=A0A3Q7JL27_SOLLC